MVRGFILINKTNGAGWKRPQTGKEIQPDLTKEPVKTVVDFLKWYRENYEKISKIQMVNMPPLEDHDSVYTVNFDKIEEYLTFLKTSGFIYCIFFLNKL